MGVETRCHGNDPAKCEPAIRTNNTAFTSFIPATLPGPFPGQALNGDGSLTYPGPEGPLSTIRLENIADGIEDTHLWTLLAAAATKNASCTPSVLISKLVSNSTARTEDPALLEQIRREAARQIIAAAATQRTAPVPPGSTDAAAAGAAAKGSSRVSLSNVALPKDTDGKTLLSGEVDVLVLDVNGTATYHLYINNWGGCKGVDCCPSDEGCLSCCFDASPTHPIPVYNDSCVYASNHSIHLYTTVDFVSWENKGAVFTQTTPGVLYRPHVVHSRGGLPERQFLMWIRNCSTYELHGEGYAVLAARYAAGPFLPIAGNVLPPPDGSTMTDHDVHVDPNDGVGYLVRGGYVNKLVSDYTAVDPKVPAVTFPMPASGETPCMFQRKRKWFILTGYHCCACKGGSNIWVVTADHPLGPWRYIGDIGLNKSTSPAKSFLPDGAPRVHSPYSFSTRSQVATVFKIINNSSETVVFLGNQWVTASSPGRPRNQDLFFWAALDFDVQTGNPKQVEWADAMVLDGATGKVM